MKKIIIPFLAVLLLAACNTSSDKNKDAFSIDESMLYTSEDGSFSVFFPQTPQIEEESVETEVGTIVLKTYIYEESLDKAYMVAYSDYPDLLMTFASPEELLQGGKHGALASLGIDNLIVEENIEKNGVRGLYFRGDDGDTYHVEYEIYLKGNRLYQVALIETQGRSASETDKKFFSSFRFN
jgi:predicted RNase H-like HicB family nuclease